MAEKKIIIAGFQQRRDTVENWETKNPVLRDGEQITVILKMALLNIKLVMVVKSIQNSLSIMPKAVIQVSL